MPEPTAFLHALRASSADLVHDLLSQQWSDADVSAPSLCVGWTRGHVLTHIARNADGIADTLAGALRGEIVARYPDGWDSRNAAIDEGATRPFAALTADVRESADRLDRVLGAVGDADGWELPTEHGDPAGEWVLRRWREVEMHHVDLAGDYTPERWPPLYVLTMLPDAADTLAARTDESLRVTIAAEGSLSAELVDREWTVGTGDPVDVRGPDWAVLAWLAGRSAVATKALSTAPTLREWR
jgi:maleylpyruvate isomerase